MFEDIRKSINSILYERITSPLFGTLIVSWSLWNWKIIYLTVFVSEHKIKMSKLEYISTYYADSWFNYGYPIISTIILITVIPIFSNGAYWISISYDKWRHNKKNEVEMQQTITNEQQMEMLKQFTEQQERFQQIIEQKDTEIKTQRLANINSKEEIDRLKDNIKRQSESSKPFRILSATYGAGDNTIDVTEKLKSFISGDGVNVQVSNLLFGEDPVPGLQKKLLVVFEFHGQVQTVAKLEGDLLKIPELN